MNDQKMGTAIEQMSANAVNTQFENFEVKRLLRMWRC